MKNEKPMTWGELKAAIANLDAGQLAMPVRWWGEERGGEATRLDVLEEEFVCMSEGYEPRSLYEGENADPNYNVDKHAEGPPIPKGAPILAVD